MSFQTGLACFPLLNTKSVYCMKFIGVQWGCFRAHWLSLHGQNSFVGKWKPHEFGM